MEKVVVGLDMHLKKTEGVVMAMDGAIVKRERFETSKENLRNFLRGLPPGTIVAGIGVRGGGLIDCGRYWGKGWWVKAYERKKDKRKAIKIVARKLVNIIWAIWTYEREFHE